MSEGRLLPYQESARDALISALKTHGAALDASDMGTGKTWTAVGVIQKLNLPTLCVVPAISVSSWKRVGEQLNTEFDVVSMDLVRGGNTPYGRWENPLPKKRSIFFRCEKCQLKFNQNLGDFTPCPYGSGIHCIETLKRKHEYGRFVWASGIRLLVFDEAHRAGALDSLQGDMLVAAKRESIPTLLISGTALDSPLGARAIGYSLNLHSLVGSGGFWSWAIKRGCRKIPFRGFQFCGTDQQKKKIMAGLHAEIFPSRGVRVRISDLGDAFPACKITAELYDVASPDRINSLYEQMAESIAAVHERRDADGELPITNLLRGRMEIELLKIPVFVELANDALAQGFHVAIFVNFRASVQELCTRLKTDCRVDGSQTGAAGKAKRDKNVEDFQSDKEPVIILTSAAGGVSISLHDLHGKFPRLGLVSPGFSSRELRQVFGRLRRQGGRSPAQYRVLFAADTVEAQVHRTLSAKLDRLDALNDGDLMPENLKFDTRIGVSEATIA